MVVADISAGAHVVEFTRDCYVKQETRIPVDKPDDYTVGPIPLQHAVASLTVRANDPRAQVVVDGQARGSAPFTHRGPVRGRAHRGAPIAVGPLLQAPAGPDRRQAVDRRRVEAGIRPAVGVRRAAGRRRPAGGRRAAVRSLGLGDAVRAAVGASRIRRFARNQLPAGVAGLRREQAADGQLDGSGAVDAPRPRARSWRSTFGSQGVAAITVIDRNRVVLSILAAGSNDPDVIEVSLDNARLGAAGHRPAGSHAGVLPAVDRPRRRRRRRRHRRGGGRCRSERPLRQGGDQGRRSDREGQGSTDRGRRRAVRRARGQQGERRSDPRRSRIAPARSRRRR